MYEGGVGRKIKKIMDKKKIKKEAKDEKYGGVDRI